MARSVSFDILANDRASDALLKVGASIGEVERKIKDLNDKGIRIDADTDAAERKLKLLHEEAREATGDRRLQVDADITRAEAELRRLRESRIKVDADTTSAEAKLTALREHANHIDGKRINVKADADTGSAFNELSRLGTQLRGLASLGSPLVIGVALVGAGDVLGKIAQLSAGLTALGGLGLVGGGIVKAAFTGIGDAVTEVEQKDTAAASSMKSNANAVKDAVRGVEMAQRSLRDAIDGVADAQRGVQRATENVTIAQRDQARAADGIVRAQEGIARAQRGVADAERNLSDAQRSAAQVQEDLNDARKRAAERLEDLQRREEDLRMSQASASLSVLEAEQRLQEVMVDPKATDLQRARARLSVEDARKRVGDLADDAKRLGVEKAEADRKGVDGSDEVRSALDRQAQAQRRVEDAVRAVEDAQRGVRDAQRGVTDAQYAYEDAVRRTRDAQLSVVEATKKVADAQQAVKDRQYDVARAQERVREASQQAGAAGVAAADKQREAFQRLTPEGQRFVDLLVRMKNGPLKDLQDAAQRGLLPGLGKGIEGAFGVLTKGGAADAIERIATHMGKMAEKLGPKVGEVVLSLIRLVDRIPDSAWKGWTDSLVGLLDRLGKWIDGKSADDITKDFKDLGGMIKDAKDGIQGLYDILVLIGKLDDPFGGSSGIGSMFGSLASAGGKAISGDGRGAAESGKDYAAKSAATLLKPTHGLLDKAFGIDKGSYSSTLDRFYNEFRDKLTGANRFSAEWAEDVRGNANKAGQSFVDAERGKITPSLSNVRSNGLTTKTIMAGVVLSAIRGDLGTTGQSFKAFADQRVRPAWESVKNAGGTAKTWLSTNVWTPIGSHLKTLGDKFGNLDKQSVRDAFESIKTRGGTLKDNLKDRVFKGIEDAITRLKKAFEGARDAIGTALDKIRDKAAIPLRFVVNTVFGGLVRAFNGISSRVGGPTFTDPVASFARGGQITGPGTGTSDDVPILASNGEWIIRAAAAQRLGPRVMEAINNADRVSVSGDIGGITVGRPKFASGGLIDSSIAARVPAVRSWLPSVDPLPYVWGGVGPGGYDCSGLVGEVWARLTGRASYRRNFDTLALASNPGAYGFAPGPGLFTVGVNDNRIGVGSGQHTAGSLAGYGFEAASTASGIKVGGAARSATSFAKVLHLASLGTDGAGGFDLIGWFKDKLGKAIDGLTGGWWSKLNGDGAFGQLGVSIGKTAVDQVRDAIPALLKNVNPLKALTSIFDSGGLLQPGANLVYNGTGKPEPVLTSGQWDTVERALPITRGGRGGGEVHHHYHVDVRNAVVGNSQQLTKEIVSAIKSAKATGLLPQGV